MGLMREAEYECENCKWLYDYASAAENDFKCEQCSSDLIKAKNDANTDSYADSCAQGYSQGYSDGYWSHSRNRLIGKLIGLALVGIMLLISFIVEKCSGNI